MNKYKLVLTDGLREELPQIDWGALAFDAVDLSEAENGSEVHKADAILADISCPGAEAVLSKYQKAGCKIIIVSKSRDFRHFKNALRVGALDYITKPADASELHDALVKVRCTLDENAERKLNEDKLREKYEKSLPVMRERFLNELLWGFLTRDEIYRRLNLYNLSIGGIRYKMTIVFEKEIGADGVRLIPREPAVSSIVKIIKEKLSLHCKSEVFLCSPLIVAITAWDAPGFTDDALEIVSGICSKCLTALEIKLSAGIGGYYDQIENVHNSFEEAKTALYKSAHSGTAVYFGDVAQYGVGCTPYDDRCEEKLLSTVRFGSQNQIALLSSEIFDKLKGLAKWERRAYLCGVLNELFRIIRRYDLNNEEVITDLIDRLFEFADELYDKREIFTELCLKMSSLIKTKHERAKYNLAEDAKRYIEAHCGDSDLSVARVCAHLHISQSYFSTVFKTKTGVSFVQYVTELRMSRAVTLLQQTSDKTNVIAGKIGYEDPNYFCYVFKKRFGVSPSRYRKK